jgi:hypothetical protein
MRCEVVAMKHILLPRVWTLVTLFSLFSAIAAAGEIYKWVTPDGVTHYSETTPEAVLASVEIIELEVPEPVTTAPRDYRSMLEVAERIEAGRLERERLRLEKRRMESGQRTQDVATEDYDPPAARIYYPAYPGYRHLHDKPRLRPVPPPGGRGHKPPGREDRPNALTRIAP